MSRFLHWLGAPANDDIRGVVEGSWHLGRDASPALLWVITIAGIVAAGINWIPQVAMRLSARTGTTLLRLAMTAVVLAVAAGLEWRGTLEIARRPSWTVLLDDSGSMSVADVEGSPRYAAALRDLRALDEALRDRVDLTIETVSGRPTRDLSTGLAPEAANPGIGPTLLRDAIARAALARSRSDRLVLLTDGRDSEGRDLSRVGEDLAARGTALSIRLYGSTSPPADSGIDAEPDRSVLRLGEELVLRGTIAGPTATAERVVALKENGREIRRINVPPGASRFEARHRPAKKGVHVYTLELPRGDAAAANDAASVAISVVEEKINVLLLEGFPRYEFKLFKAVLEVDPLVNLVCVSRLPGGGVYVQGEPLHKNAEQGLIASQAELFKYDVAILRDVPRTLFRAGGDATETRLRNLVEFVTKRGGGLLACGGQDVYRAGGYEDSPLAEILPFDLTDALGGAPHFDGRFHATVAKGAVDHPLLRLLPDPDENRRRWAALRELDGSNNVGRTKPIATPLLTRAVSTKGPGDSSAEREAPVLAYMAVGDGKVLATSVDTLWRWQLQPDYDDPPLAALLANAVRYLAPPPGRRPGLPSIDAARDVPQLGQDLVLSTELRDPNYDPIIGADLVVTTKRPGGDSFRIHPRDLPDEPGVYQYRVPLDEPGTYVVTARHQKLEQSREFTVGSAAGEFADLSADRAGMDRLAKAAGGEVISRSGTEWLNTFDVEGNRAAVARELEAWNSPLVALLFLALVSADCFLRKRQGLA